MTKTFTISGETFELESIEAMKGPALLSIFNECAVVLNVPSVHRFADLATARKRTLKIATQLAELQAAEAAKVAEKQIVKAGKRAPKEPKAEGAPRGKRQPVFVFPFDPEVSNKSVPREGTRRRILYDMLTAPEGATFEELHAATWANEESLSPERQVRATYEGLRLLHFYCGYGMRQDAEGRIFLVTSAK